MSEETSGEPAVTTDEAAVPPTGSPRLLIVAAVTLVIGLPICAVVFAYMNPSPASGGQLGATGAPGDGHSEPGFENVGSPTEWARPSWADGMRGMTATELPADSDVPFANGRFRPALGVTCAGGTTEVYVVTEGTAIVDWKTSSHAVHLTFDEEARQTQQWAAAEDMRTLFAPQPIALANQVKRSKRLSLGFSHYMGGPTVVDFDLRGAETVIDSMADRCGWDATAE